MKIERDGEVFEEQLHYSHLALGRLLVEHSFERVLEIGSAAGTVARALRFLGKDVTTVEIVDAYAASHSGDYLDCRFQRPFEAIWCSHVLEHQRNVGRFCDKLFDDLVEGGVLALTVPSALSPMIIGHCNVFTPLHLLYHLILAGFDCSEARVKCYDWQVSVIVRKKANGLPRISFATTDIDFPKGTTIGYDPELLSYFPESVARSFDAGGHAWGEVESVNW